MDRLPFCCRPKDKNLQCAIHGFRFGFRPEDLPGAVELRLVDAYALATQRAVWHANTAGYEGRGGLHGFSTEMLTFRLILSPTRGAG